MRAFLRRDPVRASPIRVIVLRVTNKSGANGELNHILCIIRHCYLTSDGERDKFALWQTQLAVTADPDACRPKSIFIPSELASEAKRVNAAGEADEAYPQTAQHLVVFISAPKEQPLARPPEPLAAPPP